jgi:hypothetical protein
MDCVGHTPVERFGLIAGTGICSARYSDGQRLLTGAGETIQPATCSDLVGGR